MPRKPRFIIPHVPVHIVQRGHCRNPIFFDDADCLAYLNWLKAGALRYKVAVHAYVLMTNHIHILATPTEVEGIACMSCTSPWGKR
jgi:putative transposase